MLVGYLGGTFDPVHKGHLNVARQILARTPLREVRLVLAARPGHRATPVADVAHRWAMLKLACESGGDARLIPDDTELDRQGPSYTIDTLLQVHKRGQNWLPCWILGWDAFVTLHQWYRWEEIMEFCNLLVVERPGQNELGVPNEIRRLLERHEADELSLERMGQIVRLDIPTLNVSATQVRDHLAHQGSVEELLDDPVHRYIIREGLYDAQ
ncbi:MAG: nicotinate-nucleotide adenylyltransferase [Pseudomonadota bacterium]